MKTLMYAVSLSLCMTYSVHAQTTHVVALAACPEWKHGSDDAETERMLAMCERDVSLMVDALRESLGVEESNTTILQQEDATSANLIEAFEDLETRVEAGDLIIYYHMSHGGIIPHSYEGYPVNDEVFVLWTDDEPEDYTAAVQSGDWLSARRLRDLISDFNTATQTDMVVIIEACHSQAAFHDFRHNARHSLNSGGRMAVIFSAGDEQTSTFNDDATGARFTETFVASMNNAASGNTMLDVFFDAGKNTFIGNQQQCLTLPEEELAAMYREGNAFHENCEQTPAFFDPEGLLVSIAIERTEAPTTTQ